MSPAAPVLSPRQRRADGRYAFPAHRDIGAKPAAALAVIAKALGDPTRFRIVDVIRKAAPEAVCQCELVPLFDMSQPALAKHLKVLVDAGILTSERRGTWTYYYPRATGLEELTAWLG